MSPLCGYFRFFAYFSGSFLNESMQSSQQKPIFCPLKLKVWPFGSTGSPETGHFLLTGADACVEGLVAGAVAACLSVAAGFSVACARVKTETAVSVRATDNTSIRNF